MKYKKNKILIVDDSSLITERLILILKEHNNVGSINHSVSYTEALDLLTRLQFDIIFLDINLPDTSGIKLLTPLKTKSPETVVIMFTNQGSQYYKNLCKSKGADYFIDKSKDIERISEIISSLN